MKNRPLSVAWFDLELWIYLTLLDKERFYSKSGLLVICGQEILASQRANQRADQRADQRANLLIVAFVNAIVAFDQLWQWFGGGEFV